MALHQQHRHLNLKLFAFTPEDIMWKERRIKGQYLSKRAFKERRFPLPDVVYNRAFNKKSTTVRRLGALIGEKKCFNSINFFNKWELHNSLLQTELLYLIPETFSYNTLDLDQLLKEHQLLYIKPTYGVRGNSVYRIERKEQGDTHISLHTLAPLAICRKYEGLREKLTAILKPGDYIVQQGIRTLQLNQCYFDIRVLVQKDISGSWTISAITSRVAYEQYFNTSMCESVHDSIELFERLLTPKKLSKTLQTLHKASLMAAQVADSHMGSLGELSVDFVLDEQLRLWIIELNGKPQKDIYYDIETFINREIIHTRPLEYAYYLAQMEKK
ncbi:YheC/YheD family endospore coat-associated protein [Paenibacillus albidus]|uniref:YheC/YheD family endospore coat-associated protein n=1 Tax=Paenibacillus albidus TaxID=2041023 RepID=UPI001E4E6F66|nr:YheC/YheD family protein [Paenibacillus albidus]